MKSVPPQPGEDTWKFIGDLKSPLWTKHAWELKSAGPEQADLSKGVTIKENFLDPKNRLETAYEDLRTFLAAGNVTADKGEYTIETVLSPDLKGEAFRLEIEPKGCRILAGDEEGIRRGIFQLEDEMLRLRGPYLPLGTTEKHTVVERRISRCVYGPIKRPPAMRDELMDDVDYYPDQYLNRLAHDGVNGLWLTVEFRDLVTTKFTPEAGKDGKKRLEKLRRTVAQCLRYGIKTYIFTIEPRAWGNQPPYYKDIYVLDQYPELGGVRRGNTVNFCPMSNNAQEYLYQVVNTIFSEVPELGGMINISHGERTTTCASSISSREPYKGEIACPRCSKTDPWDVLYTSLSSMKKGMHDASPDAELISWLYHASTEWAEWVFKIPTRTPEGVVLQINFESGVTRTEFGKRLKGGDYWLSTPGPGDNFVRQAEIARESGTKVSAKLQTGNSHEVASIPYVPVPSMVYRKFSAMRSLGVSHAMLGWYFGNYPGIMIKSAGLLSFEPFPEDEDIFLRQLASVYWKKEDIPMVVEAWKDFAEGYGNYPLQGEMGYYGPMHDGPVWPLLLKPADAPLSPTWLLGSSFTLKRWPPSGDRIGECLWRGTKWIDETMENVLTLEETIELCRRMSTTWDKGVAILNKLEPKYNNEPERILDIGLAKALGIQFRSGYNILRFYQMREEMLRMEGRERLDILKQLEDIIKEEIEMDKQLIGLCEKDSRLGFHSEAEGYKYFPEKIRWRMQQLRDALTNDLPDLKRLIHDDKPLFPEYTGKEPAGAVAYAIRSTGFPGSDLPEGLQWQRCTYGSDTSTIRWAATYDKDAMYIIVSDQVNPDQTATVSTISAVTVKVEPRRLWLCARFVFNPGIENPADNAVRVVKGSGKWYVISRIPFKSFWWSDEAIHPLRVDVHVQKSNGKTSSWCPYNPNLGTHVTYRTSYLTDKPTDLGWLVFRE
ncbi:MAG: hypothetical protein JXA23_00560 [Bacteroidales bacterium]|nr:hypothetical protein [Bacteroidales bacterium]